MTVRQIADLIGGSVEGDGEARIEAVAAIDSAGPADLTFAADERHTRQLGRCRAAAAIVCAAPEGAPMALILVEDAQDAFARLLGELAGDKDLPPPGVHPSAEVHESAELAADVAVGPGVVIGERVRIGAKSVICAHATLSAGVEVGAECVLHEGVAVKAGCKIANRVQIEANSVIGADGFGYYTRSGAHRKIPHIGTVIIEDDVEIGACSCVDRAKFGATRIGAGSKIDNLVQIAHSVQIGRGCLLASLAGVAGSARLGQYTVLGGHVGIRDNITIGSEVRVGACTCVAADVADGQAVFGTPANPARLEMRIQQARKKLPELLRRVKSLEERLDSLESAKDH